MKNLILIFLVAVLATSCEAQTSKASEGKLAKVEAKEDSTLKPKERWKVNKKVDENGNIIRYDSIYSWSSGGDLNGMDTDRILKQMRQRMQRQFSLFNNQPAFGFAEHDSIMKHFFSDDIFSEDGFTAFPSTRDMMKRMEAMREEFFNERESYIIPPEPKSKKPSLEKKQI